MNIIPIIIAVLLFSLLQIDVRFLLIVVSFSVWRGFGTGSAMAPPNQEWEPSTPRSNISSSFVHT